MTVEYAARVLGAGDARAAAACARAAFVEPVQLPAQLPPVDEIRAAAALLGDGDEAAGGDGGADEVEQDSGGGGGGTGEELGAEDVSGGLVGYHVGLLQAWVSAGVDLTRSTVKMQGSVSVRNISNYVVRYLKWCVAETSAAHVRTNGLFCIGDGSLLAKYVSFMMNAKGLKLASITACAYALQKGVEFLARSLAPEPTAAWETYCGRVKLLLAQLQVRHASAAAAVAAAAAGAVETDAARARREDNAPRRIPPRRRCRRRAPWRGRRTRRMSRRSALCRCRTYSPRAFPGRRRRSCRGARPRA